MGSLSGFISVEKSDLSVFRKIVTSQGSTLTKSARRYGSLYLTASIQRHGARHIVHRGCDRSEVGAPLTFVLAW